MTHIPSANMRIDICKRLVAMRKIVGVALGYSLCPNPVWDMLLDLYLADYDDRDVFMLSLCGAANIPSSTAQRKIVEMERAGWLRRESTDSDRRCIGVRLTPEGTELVNSLLDGMLDILRSGDLPVPLPTYPIAGPARQGGSPALALPSGQAELDSDERPRHGEPPWRC